MTFVYGASGGLQRRNNLMGIIDHPMVLIARATLESTLTHERRLGIGRTAKVAIGFGELPYSVLSRCTAARARWRFIFLVRLIQLLELLPRGSLNGTEYLCFQRLNRTQRGMGIDQAGVDMDFAARHQPGLDALLHHSAKER